MRVLSKMGIIAATALLVFTLSSAVHAQGDPFGGGKTTSGAGSVTGPTRTGGPKVVTRTVKQTVYVTPTTSALTIVAESGAIIKLEHLSKSGEVMDVSENTIPIGQRSIILNDLHPGLYRVVAELNGYHQASSEIKKIVANSPDKVELNLTPITYNLTVRVNAPSGTILYAKGSELPREVQFQNYQTTLFKLTGGDYTITIQPDDASYQHLVETLRVSSDDTISRTLVKREESKEFYPTAAGDWALPAGWSFLSGKVRVNGSGIAVPSDNNFRNYKNFHLSAVVTMRNGVAASFAVHAVDSQNYYLVQITGPNNTDDRYVLRGYIVKNGAMQRFGRTFTISQFSKTLTSPKGFQVSLTMEGNTISVKVLDTETGDPLLLGTLADPSNAFPIGAVGVAARENEQNEIAMFIICSAEKMRANKCLD